ncbi:hypothetical protein FPV67DRAFT_885396 [Lyophyllum atratum]|nr:hypothetical protein FPV67DRAFT_885396 [Lyophyllum atratum]
MVAVTGLLVVVLMSPWTITPTPPMAPSTYPSSLPIDCIFIPVLVIWKWGRRVQASSMWWWWRSPLHFENVDDDNITLSACGGIAQPTFILWAAGYSSCCELPLLLISNTQNACWAGYDSVFHPHFIRRQD